MQKRNDECQIQSSGFLKGRRKGKEYSGCFYYFCFSFKSDVKQIWQNNKDLRSCNELTVFIHYYFLMLYCMLKTFHLKMLRISYRSLHMKVSIQLRIPTEFNHTSLNIWKDLRQGPWGPRDTISILVQS